MFSDFMSMTFSVNIFIVCIHVSMYSFVYLDTHICIMYVCASDDGEHQWYFRMDLCLLIMFVFVCMYVCMYVFLYVFDFLQFMVISIILTRVFYFMCL
jgi:hypothetical protein